MSVSLPCYHSARKRPQSFCQKCLGAKSLGVTCRWQVTHKHSYTLDPAKTEWADHAAVQAKCGNLPGNELTRDSSGNTRPQSPHLAEPLWTDPGVNSGISMRELISILKKKVKKSAGGE